LVEFDFQVLIRSNLTFSVQIRLNSTYGRPIFGQEDCFSIIHIFGQKKLFFEETAHNLFKLDSAKPILDKFYHQVSSNSNYDLKLDPFPNFEFEIYFSNSELI